jgi:hypothetical protein
MTSDQKDSSRVTRSEVTREASATAAGGSETKGATVTPRPLRPVSEWWEDELLRTKNALWHYRPSGAPPFVDISPGYLAECAAKEWAIERDELLAALKELHHASPASGWEQLNAHKLAAEVIAKCEGR